MADLDLTAETLNFKVEQGATLDITFTYRDSVGEPVDLNGYSAVMQVRSSADSDTVLLEFNSAGAPADGLIELSSGTENLRLFATDEVMAAVAAGSYKQDFELISPSGSVSKMWKGKFQVVAEVTR